MRDAWALKLKYGDTVWSVEGKTGRHTEWKFKWYTKAGARLWDQKHGRYHSRLINWDKGDTIYNDKQILKGTLLYNLIVKKSKAQLIIDNCDKEIEQIISEIANEVEDISR
jgi:hypothetical protein